MGNTPALWDAIWRQEFPEWDELSDRIFNTLKTELGLLVGRQILEAGSGTGRISCALAREGAEVCLVDYSEKALEVSRAYFSKCGARGHFVRSDIRAMPFEDNSFDVVWSAGVLEHFDSVDQARILSEMARVTRDGGTVIVIVPYAGSPFYQLGKWWAEALGTWTYGTEKPMFSLSSLARGCPVDLMREYTIASGISLDFLSYVMPRWSALEGLARLKTQMESRLEPPGYMLVSVMRVRKEQKSTNTWYDDMEFSDSFGNKPILCLSSIDWDFLWQRPQHLMVRFAAMGRRVVFINAQQLVMSGFESLPEAEAELNLMLASSVARFSKKVKENLFVVKPVARILDSRGRSRDVLGEFLKQVTIIYDLDDYVCWVLSPTWVPRLHQLPGNKTIIYDCVDEHAGFFADDSVSKLEAELIEQADIVLAASHMLLESKRSRAKEIHYVPNGISSSIVMPPEMPSPSDMQPIPRPRIGFVGAIASWKVDKDLIREAASKRPDYSFVLIGPALMDTSSLDLPNIFLLGPKPYDMLPQYYKELDVGIIPFVESDILTKHCNPIKAYEYIAAGLPVVSTRVPELEHISHLVNIADSADDFVRLLDMAVDGKLLVNRAILEEFRKTYDWENIAVVADRIMKAHMWATRGVPEAALRQVEAVAGLYQYPKAIVNLYRRLSLFERTAGRSVVPLEVRGRSDTLILAFYEGDDQGAPWKVALRSFLENCYHEASVTFGLRVDPLETDVEMAVNEVSRFVIDAGFDLEGVSNVILINDDIALAEMDRLLVAADAIIEPGMPSRRFLVEKARAMGCAVVAPDGIESYLKETIGSDALGGGSKC